MSPHRPALDGCTAPYAYPRAVAVLLRRGALLCLLLCSAAGHTTTNSSQESPVGDGQATTGDTVPGAWLDGEYEGSGGLAGQDLGVLSPAVNDVTVCVLIASPFVSLKPAISPPDQNNGPYEMHLDEFTGKFQGFDVDLIVAITRLKLSNATVTVRILSTFPETLYNVRNGTCHFAAASLTHTGYRGQCEVCPEPEPGKDILNTHACCLEFTRGYFRDSMTVVTRNQETKPVSKVLGKFWQPTMIEALCALVLSLLASGHVMWWLERKRNRCQFPDSYLDGVDDGVWWSFVTMTTVGYGDKVPVTILGRIIACMWMITGIILFGVINASIVLALAVNNVPLHLIGLEDSRLIGTTICSTPGAFEEYLPQYNHRADVVFMESLHECYNALANYEVDSIFYDRLPLLHGSDVRVCDMDCPLLQIPSGVEIGKAFQPVDFAVAMPLGGALNSLISDAVDSLVKGASVFGDGSRAVGFGFSLEAANMLWTDFNIPLYDTRVTASHYSSKTWLQSKIWMAFTGAMTVLYLLGQFGGLWLRHIRDQRSIRNALTTMQSLKRRNSTSDQQNRQLQAALHQSGINEVVGKLRKDVSMLRRASITHISETDQNMILGAVNALHPTLLADDEESANLNHISEKSLVVEDSISSFSGSHTGQA